MSAKYKIGLGVLLAAAVVAVTGWYLHGHMVSVLQPAGEIGSKEKHLIILVVALSAGIVVPVFGLLGYFAWHYRESNHEAIYSPELAGNNTAETIWWLIPSVLIGIISIITWQSSYALDPFKLLASNKPALHIQVVALDWKWLFIYPNQQVASVNEAAIPVGTPVDFEITSDAVMTSFWAPQLGGQMYAMPGMSTQLNLQAAKPGSYGGAAANISGKGFADMKFTIKAVSDADFTSWVTHAQDSAHSLTPARYTMLARPSTNNRPDYYGSVQPQLYDTIVIKYMSPISTNTNGVNG